jgi:lipopolysaccharide export LptBFGC system permease protein LptF
MTNILNAMMQEIEAVVSYFGWLYFLLLLVAATACGYGSRKTRSKYLAVTQSIILSLSLILQSALSLTWQAVGSVALFAGVVLIVLIGWVIGQQLARWIRR